MEKKMSQLEHEINELKRELDHWVEKTGLNSPATLYYSRKLDVLIFDYQTLKQSGFQNYDTVGSCRHIQ